MKYHFFASLFIFFVACQPYRQDIIFKTDQEIIAKNVQQQLYDAESTYEIAPGDYLELQVYTNKGELILDPNFELRSQTAGAVRAQERQINYVVDENGVAKFPIVGEVKVEGNTLREAEKVLEEQYSLYYEQPFVNLRYNNKRVVVLGAPGGQIIRLENEKVSLIEVLAMAGGLSEDAKGHNIRIIRGNLENPEVFLVDLSTVEGMSRSVIPIRPNDIIYIEPLRRKLVEQVSYISPIVSVITSIAALVFIITQ